jgi:hypothetical protein
MIGNRTEISPMKANDYDEGHLPQTSYHAAASRPLRFFAQRLCRFATERSRRDRAAKAAHDSP